MVSSAKADRMAVKQEKIAAGTYLCLYQIDPLGSQLSHAVKYVHDTFILCHVKHDVNGNKAPCPPGTSAAKKNETLINRPWRGRAVKRRKKSVCCRHSCLPSLAAPLHWRAGLLRCWNSMRHRRARLDGVLGRGKERGTRRHFFFLDTNRKINEKRYSSPVQQYCINTRVTEHLTILWTVTEKKNLMLFEL